MGKIGLELGILYYHDSGVIGKKRFIVGFNPSLFAEDRNNRDEKIKFFILNPEPGIYSIKGL